MPKTKERAAQQNQGDDEVVEKRVRHDTVRDPWQTAICWFVWKVFSVLHVHRNLWLAKLELSVTPEHSPPIA